MGNCPHCGQPIKSKTLQEALWDFNKFMNYFTQHVEYPNFAKYDLENYFTQVKRKYSAGKEVRNFSELAQKIFKFIECDLNNPKFQVKYAKAEKLDSVGYAYKLVYKNLEWLRKQGNLDVLEAADVLFKKYSGPCKSDPLFEHYIERGIKHYTK